MRPQSVSVTVGIIVILLTTSFLALYYRNRAVFFQQEHSAAMVRLAELSTAAGGSGTATPPAGAARKTPGTSRDADADNRPVLRQDTEGQVVENEGSVPLSGVTNLARGSESERARRRPADWIENLRTNDPQRYAEFEQRRQEMQQRTEDAWSQATDYFLNRDTSKMSQRDLEQYDTMISLLDQTWALNQQLQSGLPPEQRHEVIDNLRSNMMAVVPLLEKERNREYFDMAVAMGQNERDAATMVSYINRIASNTSLRAILPGVRMGGGMPGGPRPPDRRRQAGD